MTDSDIQTYKGRSHNIATAYCGAPQQGSGYARLLTVAPPDPCTHQIPIRIIRMHEVLYRIGLCRASIYNKMADGSFPKPIKLGIHAVGWVESEINAWLEVRIQARQIKNGGAYIGPQLG